MAGADGTMLTIGQLAARSGFTPSALRYYERRGLLRPAGRTAGGYRTYGDDALARLRFVARAKDLGCSLDEIAELVGLVDGDRCEPAQARLHALVTDRIADARRQRAELATLAIQLQEAATALAGEPVDGPCQPSCACLDPAVACTLPSEAIAGRLDDWRRLLDSVVERRPLDGGIRLLLDPGVSPTELWRLTTAEQTCCAFFAFAITVDQRGVALEVRAPAEAAELVATIFGSADYSPTTRVSR